MKLSLRQRSRYLSLPIPNTGGGDGAAAGASGGSGDGKAGAGAAGGSGAAGAGDGKSGGEGSNDGKAGAGAGASGKTGDQGTSGAAGSEDWRDKYAGGDQKRRKALDSYNSEADYHSAFWEQRRTLSDSSRIKVPDFAKATPEELTAFYRATGVPEKEDGYKITAKVPDGLKVGDADVAALKAATAHLHKQGASNGVINAVHEFYYNAMEEAEAQKQALAAKAQETTEGNLKAKWVRDYDTNMELLDAAIAERFGGQASDFLGLQLMDGTRLGDYQPLLEAFAAIGRERANDPLFLRTLKAGSDPKSLEERKTAIMALRTSDPKQYAMLAADGGELDQINAKLQARKAA